MKNDPGFEAPSETDVTSSMLELDEPFIVEPIIELRPERRTNPPPPMSSMPATGMLVNSPTGPEMVYTDWCDEQTMVMSLEEVNELLEQTREPNKLAAFLAGDLHTRPTVKSMAAVMPPSSRPDPASLVSIAPSAAGDSGV